MKSNRAVVIVSPLYPPHMGGVERYSRFLADELTDKGYAVFIVAGSEKGEAPHSLDERSREVFRVPGITLAGGRLPVPFISDVWHRLGKRLSSYSEVYVISQTNLYLLSLKGILFAKKMGYRSAVIIHGSNYVCLKNGIVDRLEHFYERLIATMEKRNGAKFLAVSKASKAFAERIGCKVEAIAYNAVNYSEIELCTADEYDITDLPGIEDNSVIFTFSGRLIREKGILQLMEAFPGVREKYPEAVLIVSGDGPLFDTVRANGFPGIYFTGQLPHSSMLAVFKQTDCFILPSDSEGFPTTVLEAAACGAFSLVAPFGGMPEAVELTGNGSVMRGNSAEDIYRSCCEFLSNYKKKKNSVPMKKFVTWEETASSVLKILIG